MAPRDRAAERLTPERLAAVWPEARRRLVGRLEAQGVMWADAEDVVSEACLRALAAGIPTGSVDDFCRWAYRVARNLYVDGRRADSRLAPESAIDEREGAVDVIHRVEQRLLCESVLRSVAQMSPADRHALLGRPEAADRREAVRFAVRRHRVRARLARSLGGLPATAG